MNKRGRKKRAIKNTAARSSSPAKGRRGLVTTHGKTRETKREVFVMKDTPDTLVDNDKKTSRVTQRDVQETGVASSPPTGSNETPEQVQGTKQQLFV